MFHIGGIIIASAIAVIYNVGVDHYAAHRVKEMARVPFEVSNNSKHTKSTAELRRSRVGLLESLDDRHAWNNWLLSKHGQDFGEMEKVATPGEYTYMYRSYVKFDEGGTIKKSLLHIPTLMRGFVSTRRGIINIHPDGEKATLTDHFRKGLHPIIISWEGIITKQKGRLMIVWTGTSMSSGRGTERKTIVNPPMSEKLRQIPWEIVKVEDGIIAFRRGDVGMLAYARL